MADHFQDRAGIGAALLFPAALAIVVSVFPLKERGPALALFSASQEGSRRRSADPGGYPANGPGGRSSGQRPVAIIAIILALLAKIHTKHKREPLDYKGAVLIALGMGFSVLGLQQASVGLGFGNTIAAISSWDLSLP